MNKKGIVSITEVEETEERVKVLKARIKLAEEELKLTESQLDNDVRLQEAMVEKAKANPKLADWFVGQVMKATGGKANPKAVNEIVAAKLGL